MRPRLVHSVWRPESYVRSISGLLKLLFDVLEQRRHGGVRLYDVVGQKYKERHAARHDCHKNENVLEKI